MKKTIFITGASSGIGKSTAKYFVEKGWNVAASMRSPENEDELSKIKEIKLYKLDVTNEDEIAAVTQQIFKDFKRVDVLLNNAGYAEVGVFEKSTDKEVRKQFDVNVFGVMNLTREIIPYFRKQGEGVIINVTSVGGKITFPLYSIYNSSKFALEGFAESLQYELRDFNIRIKNIEPGPIKTDFYSRSQNVFENESIKGYEKYENAVLNRMAKTGRTAPGPEVVAKTIYKAAIDGGNTLRYPAGNQAYFILIFRKLMPGHWFNKILHKVMARN
jgi:short-subunit dehydrogenase